VLTHLKSASSGCPRRVLRAHVQFGLTRIAPRTDRSMLLIGVLLVASLPATLVQDAARDANWPQFRGPHASGVAEGYATVTEWDLAAGKNVLWRCALPGLAHSSPIVWGECIFLTNAVRKQGAAELDVRTSVGESLGDEGDHLFQVLCLDRRDGKILWTQTAFDGHPQFQRHPKASFAIPTPATDGEHVLAFFGTEGLFCYDPRGKLLWQKNFGELDAGSIKAPASWGFAASPVLHEGVVYVQCDVLKGSFVAALKTSDGTELWRTPREEVPTFSVPTVDVRAERSQLVCNGFKHIGGYDLATGKELWKLQGGGDVPVPTPVIGNGLIYITNAHGGRSPLFAIDAMAEGTLAPEPMDCPHMRWSDLRRGTYMQTPLVLGESLYACKDNGVLTCFEATTGKVLYEQRLGSGVSGFSSSPVAADGKLYFASEEGVVFVVKAGPEFELLRKNELGEECMATPAVSRGVLFYRTRGHLTAVGRR
jgi:outer membrane protein assembly factor BamB